LNSFETHDYVHLIPSVLQQQNRYKKGGKPPPPLGSYLSKSGSLEHIRGQI